MRVVLRGRECGCTLSAATYLVGAAVRDSVQIRGLTANEILERRERRAAAHASRTHKMARTERTEYTEYTYVPEVF